MKGKDLRSAKRVLVIKREGLRQFVEAEPAFCAIRRAHPQATIDLVTGISLQRLARLAPYFDRVVGTRGVMGNGEKKDLAGQLKKVGYAVVYDLDGTKDSMEMRSLLRGFRGPQWIGPKRPLSEGRRALAPTPLAGPGMRKLLRGNGLELEERLPDLSWTPRGDDRAANLDPSWFGLPERFGLVMPAANPQHRWPAENHAELFSNLVAQGITPVIVGPEQIVPFATDIIRAVAEAGVVSGRGPVDLSGKTDAAQLAVLAQEAQFFIAGPSEELHLVTSLGLPGVVLLPASEEMSSDALYGRHVVKLTAGRLGLVNPELAASTLRNMGLIPRDHGEPPRERRGFLRA